MGCVVAFLRRDTVIYNYPVIDTQPQIVYKYVPGPSERTSGGSQKTNVVLHSTKNYNWYAGAEFHRIYMDTTKREVSWHFTICGDTIYQHYPISAITWHAGKDCNKDGVGIELCEIRDSCSEDYRAQTIASLDALLWALDKLLPEPDLIFHEGCTGKQCPDRGWRVNLFEPVDTTAAITLKKQIQ